MESVFPRSSIEQSWFFQPRMHTADNVSDVLSRAEVRTDYTCLPSIARKNMKFEDRQAGWHDPFRRFIPSDAKTPGYLGY
jgi:hypothetical protein